MAISTIETNSLASGAVTNTSIAAAAGISTSKLGTGAVLQVAQKVFTDTTSTNTTYTYIAVTNGYLDVVTTAANSKVLVMFYAQGYQNGSGATNVGLQKIISGTTTRLLGTDGASGDTWMGAGNGPANNSWVISKQYLDSPGLAAGSTVRYQLLLGLWSQGTTYINYSGYSGQSAITIMEIAG